MSEIRINYAARPDATPESEREVLANVFALVLRIHQEREKVARTSRPEDAEGDVHSTGEEVELEDDVAF